MSIGPEPGTTIGGKYRIIRTLGEGGMGSVHLARAEGPGGFEKLVALKLMHQHLVSDAIAMEAFANEARLCAQLNHANIAQIYDLGESGGEYFMAMEFVFGRDLRSMMWAAAEREAALPIGHVCYIVAKLAEALNYAHRMKDSSGRPLKLVHRDVTPANCLVSFQGDVKLIDFGIAKVATQEGRTRPGFVKGKLPYMSPEQVLGLPLDRRSDIFSLGSVLYELLVGPRPFDGDDPVEVQKRLVVAQYVPPRQIDPTLPEELELIIARALARHPADRYQWAGELHATLMQFVVTRGELVANSSLALLLEELFPGEGGDPGLADKVGERTAPTGETVAATERVPDLDVAMAAEWLKAQRAQRAEVVTKPEGKPTSFRKLDPGVAKRLTGERKERESRRFEEAAREARALKAKVAPEDPDSVTVPMNPTRKAALGVALGIFLIALAVFGVVVWKLTTPEPVAETPPDPDEIAVPIRGE